MKIWFFQCYYNCVENLCHSPSPHFSLSFEWGLSIWPFPLPLKSPRSIFPSSRRCSSLLIASSLSSFSRSSFCSSWGLAWHLKYPRKEEYHSLSRIVPFNVESLIQIAQGCMMKEKMSESVCKVNVTLSFSCPRINPPRTIKKNPKNSISQVRVVMWMLSRTLRRLRSFVDSSSSFRKRFILSLWDLIKRV